MKDRREIERGRCNEAMCPCTEYEVDAGAILCSYCGHVPLQHTELTVLMKPSNIMDNPRQENNSLEEILNGTSSVSVNMNSNLPSSSNHGACKSSHIVTENQFSESALEISEPTLESSEQVRKKARYSKYFRIICDLDITSYQELHIHMKTFHTKNMHCKGIIKCVRCNILFTNLWQAKFHSCSPCEIEVKDLLNKNYSLVCQGDDENQEFIDDDMKKKSIENLCLKLMGKDKINDCTLNNIFQTFNNFTESATPFVTSHLRYKYFKNLDIFTESFSVDFSDGSKAYMISIIRLLQVLLKHPEMKKYFQTPFILSCEDRIMKDICHGTAFSSHPKFKNDTTHNLAFSLYTDDVEICNPLGKNRTVHKLTLIYISILNVPPQERSKLKHNYFIGVAHSNDFKNFDKRKMMLSYIVKDFKKLNEGIYLAKERFFGYLIAYHGDALALHQIASFKESFSPSVLINCHVCEEPYNNYCKIFRHESCKLSHDQYLKTCDDIEKALFDNDNIYIELSKRSGINRKSLLSEIPYFSVIKNCLFDPMHILLEGLIPSEIQLMLSSLRKSGLIQREKLNKTMTDFSYHYTIFSSDYTKPFSSDFKLKCTSKSAFVFANHILLFISHVDTNNAYVNCYKYLLAILRIVWATKTSYSSILAAKKFVTMHQKIFISLYGKEKLTPKSHMLVHLVHQLLTFGPGRNFSCIRQEGKHFICKRKRYFNFKNLPLSISKVYQIDFASDFFNGDGTSKFSNSNIKYNLKDCNIDYLQYFDQNCIMKEISFLKIDNMELKCGELVILPHNTKCPTFGFIVKILCVNNNDYILYRKTSNNFDSKYIGYNVNIQENMFVIKLKDLDLSDRVLKYNVDKKLMAIIPSSSFVPDL